MRNQVDLQQDTASFLRMNLALRALSPTNQGFFRLSK